MDSVSKSSVNRFHWTYSLDKSSPTAIILASHVHSSLLCPKLNFALLQMSQNSANSSASLKSSLKLNYFLATYCVFGSLPLLHHVCVLVLQAMHIFVNAVAHCANDGLFFSLTMHLCGQFEILKMNFAKFKIGEFGGEKKLRILVKRHCQLAVLADDLEQTFNMIILVQLLMSALLICVEGENILFLNIFVFFFLTMLLTTRFIKETFQFEISLLRLLRNLIMRFIEYFSYLFIYVSRILGI